MNRTKLVMRSGGILMESKCGVQFMDEPNCQFALSVYAIHQQREGVLVILQHLDKPSGFGICA